MAADDEVRQASDRFHAALTQWAKGDPGGVSAWGAVWSHGEDVTHLAPEGGRDVGWEQLRALFEQLPAAGGGQFRVLDQLIRVGTDLAHEVGVEDVDVTMGDQRLQFKGRFTNIYRREDGEWKMVHHHVDALGPPPQ